MDSKNQTAAMGILLTISAAHFLNDLLQSVIPASLPVLKEANALTFAEVGLITLTVQITSSHLQPFVGAVSDRHPMPEALPCGMLLSGLGLILLAHAATLPAILISVALIGCGSAVFHPESSRTAQDVSGGRRGFAQAVFQVGGNAGSAMGPIAAALVVIPYGKSSIGWFSLSAALAFLLLVGVAKTYHRAPPEAVKSAAAASGSGTAWNVKFIFAILFILMFSKQVYISSLTNFLTFYVMEKFHVDPVTAQYALFAFLGAGAAGTLLGAPITDRFGRRKVIFGSIFGAAPFALLVPYVGFWGVIALVILVSFVISSAFSAILVCALDVAPRHTGMVSGVFFGLTFGLGGAAAAFFGWLADIIGIENVFLAASFMPLAGIFALALPKKL